MTERERRIKDNRKVCVLGQTSLKCNGRKSSVTLLGLCFRSLSLTPLPPLPHPLHHYSASTMSRDELLTALHAPGLCAPPRKTQTTIFQPLVKMVPTKTCQVFIGREYLKLFLSVTGYSLFKVQGFIISAPRREGIDIDVHTRERICTCEK